MTDYYSAVEAELDAQVGGDKQLTIARTMKIDFLSGPIYLWGGIGPLVTPDGQEWAGWVGPNGEAYINIPRLTTARSGDAPEITITLGYVDSKTYQLLKDDDQEIFGRDLVLAQVLLENGKTRSIMMPGHTTRLKMIRPLFRESRSKQADGSHSVNYIVSVICKGLNAGRSGVSFGAITDTGQRSRSEQLFGIEGDQYGQFTVKYSRGYSIELY